MGSQARLTHERAGTPACDHIRAHGMLVPSDLPIASCLVGMGNDFNWRRRTCGFVHGHDDDCRCCQALTKVCKATNRKIIIWLILPRTHMFFQIAIGLLITQMCATSLAAAIMKYRSAWVAICVGYVSITVASCFTLILPETIQYRSEADLEESSKPSVSERQENIRYAGESSLRRRLRQGRLFLTESFSFLLKDWKTLAILVTFFVNTIGNAVLSIGVQYISARFGWTIAEANLLFSFRSAINAALFIFLLPGITWVLDKKYHMTTMNRDLRLAQTSVIFLPLGLFIMAFAGNISSMTTGLVIMTLGTGYSSLMRSLVTSIFERQHIARLYSAIAVFETLGSMFSGPTLAGLFQWGIHLGGMWQGMPFFTAGLMALLTAVLAWTVPVLPSQRSKCSAEDGEIEEELNRKL